MATQNEGSGGGGGARLELAQAEKLRRTCDGFFTDRWSNWDDIEALLPTMMDPSAMQSSLNLIARSKMEGRKHPLYAPNVRERIHKKYLQQMQIRGLDGPKGISSVGVLTPPSRRRGGMDWHRMEAGRAYLVHGAKAGETIVVLGDLGLGKTTLLTKYMMQPWMVDMGEKAISAISCDNAEEFPNYMYHSLQSEKVWHACEWNKKQITDNHVDYLHPSLIVTDEGFTVAQKQRAQSLIFVRYTAFWTITRHLGLVNVWSFPREDFVPNQMMLSAKRIYEKYNKRTLKTKIHIDGRVEQMTFHGLEGAPQFRARGELHMRVPEEGAADTTTWDIDTLAMMNFVNMLKRRIDAMKDTKDTADAKVDRRLIFYTSIQKYIESIRDGGRKSEYHFSAAQWAKDVSLLVLYFEQAGTGKIKPTINAAYNILPADVQAEFSKSTLYDIYHGVEKALREQKITFSESISPDEIDAIAAEVASDSTRRLLEREAERMEVEG